MMRTIDDQQDMGAETVGHSRKSLLRLLLRVSAPLRPSCLSIPLLFSFATLTAAEAPKTPPTPAAADQPATLDPVTAKKAEAAADAYLKQVGTRPDPLAETALAEIEVLLLEVHSFIDVKQPLKAGERYLSAVEKRKTIAPEQRPLLGKRLRQVDADMLALSRTLLGQPAYDLGDPPADQPAGDAPAPAK
jgi:hypothetical protein